MGHLRDDLFSLPPSKRISSAIFKLIYLLKVQICKKYLTVLPNYQQIPSHSILRTGCEVNAISVTQMKKLRQNPEKAKELAWSPNFLFQRPYFVELMPQHPFYPQVVSNPIMAILWQLLV